MYVHTSLKGFSLYYNPLSFLQAVERDQGCLSRNPHQAGSGREFFPCRNSGHPDDLRADRLDPDF